VARALALRICSKLQSQITFTAEPNVFSRNQVSWPPRLCPPLLRVSCPGSIAEPFSNNPPISSLLASWLPVIKVHHAIRSLPLKPQPYIHKSCRCDRKNCKMRGRNNVTRSYSIQSYRPNNWGLCALPGLNDSPEFPESHPPVSLLQNK